jgi:hypothetical protein
MSDDKKAELKRRLILRRKFDDKWASINFVFAQVFVGTSILASFGTAIVAASNIASPLVLSILASIPGTAIIIDRSFRFADRWRWHCIVAIKYAALEQRLTIEDASVEEISRAMSDYLFEMEKKYPAHNRGMGDETPDKKYVA